jgi:uncharacterized protein (DUF362 family)
MKRREFIKTGAVGFLGVSTLPLFYHEKLGAQVTKSDAAWIENGEPNQLLTAALKELGGMSSFVSKGDVVVIKPNMGWDRAPEYAANTNPVLIQEIVKECYNAGAKTVRVFDRTCNNPLRCYRNSKIEEMAKKVGAEVPQVRKNRFKDIRIKDGEIIKSWPIYQDYLEADKIINVPIAKHHSLSRVTLGLKNLMGVMGGNRGSIHTYFETKLTDINSELLPTLTILDAYRVLMANGPAGGSLTDVQLKKILIASKCTVAVDFLGLELFGLKLDEVGHIKKAAERGLNRFDLQKLNVKRIKLA